MFQEVIQSGPAKVLASGCCFSYSTLEIVNNVPEKSLYPIEISLFNNEGQFLFNIVFKFDLGNPKNNNSMLDVSAEGDTVSILLREFPDEVRHGTIPNITPYHFGTEPNGNRLALGWSIQKTGIGFLVHYTVFSVEVS